MPQKVGSIRRPDQPNLYKVQKSRHIEFRKAESKLYKTSTRHRKNPNQSGVVVVDSCFAIIVAYQDGVTNREYLLKNNPLALN